VGSPPPSRAASASRSRALPRELRDQADTLARAGSSPVWTACKSRSRSWRRIRYFRGPEGGQERKDAFLIGYVLFDKKLDFAEVDVVEACQQFLNAKHASVR
jgi:Cu(I)/Ag(I) efflux system membrane protein CusA/SilA